ncbi:MAG: DUF6946 family protein [Rhodanobacter sp.]
MGLQLTSRRYAALFTVEYVEVRMQLFFDKQAVSDFDELLRMFSDADLDSPLRSTVPLLAFWRHPHIALADFAKAVRAPISSPVQLAFEYTVPVSRGKGKPSCTDLMIISPDACIAVEAKFTEPAYASVQDWLGSPESHNRKEVLLGWLAYIEQRTGAKLEIKSVASLPYQMIHRTASACALSGKKPVLTYMVFGSASEYYRVQLGRWRDVLRNAASLEIHLIECPLAPLLNAEDLNARWIGGSRNMAAAVRSALQVGPLYQFGTCRSVELEAPPTSAA